MNTRRSVNARQRRRPTTRTYWVATDKWLRISKEWSMKYGQDVYYVINAQDGKTLLCVPTFHEAKQFVRETKAARL